MKMKNNIVVIILNLKLNHYIVTVTYFIALFFKQFILPMRCIIITIIKITIISGLYYNFTSFKL